MKPRILLYVSLVLLLVTSLTNSKVLADPIPPLRILPFCGDQDGSENPPIPNCDRFVLNPDAQAYTVYLNPDNPEQTIDVRFDFVFREAGYNNELGFFQVDDFAFSVDGLHPGDPGYLTAASRRMRIIFPSGADAFTPDVTMSFEDEETLVFFIIQNSTLAQWKELNPNNEDSRLPLAFFSIDSLNPDGVDHFVGYYNVGDGLTQFGFEDLTGGGDLDYDDVVYDMNVVAQPVSTAPPYTTSYYIKKTDRVGIYELGCNQGKKDRDFPGTQDGAVILDFYGPTERTVSGVKEFGLTLYSYSFVSMADVADYAEQFAKGYYNCLGNDLNSHLRVIIGTNNSTGPYVNYNAGRAFGKMVNDVATWVKNNGYSRNVDIAGGNDMEVAYNTAAATKAWMDGYSSISTRYLYDFGDSQGCPQSGTTSTTRSCDRGWTQEDIWYISWKSPTAWPFPEIYNTVGSQDRQWQQLSLYSFFKSNYPRMQIAGALTQWQACQQGSPCPGTDNKPEVGWKMLFDTLAKDPRTSQDLRWSSDIKHWPNR